MEFVENAHSEESAIYFKENKFGEDVLIKKKNNCDKYVYFLVVIIYPRTRTYIVPDQAGIEWYVFVLILLEIIWRRTPRLNSPIVLDDVIKYFL